MISTFSILQNSKSMIVGNRGGRNAKIIEVLETAGMLKATDCDILLVHRIHNR